MTAWRRAWHLAEDTPRRTPGSIRMAGYQLRYFDLMSLCPGWHDIFVKHALDFRAPSDAPRILDCGANIGLASLYFKRKYPRARITAYEADPALAEMLADNLRRNGAGDVDVVHAALWTSTAEVVFQCERGDSGMIAALPGAVEGDPQTVPSLRLRDVLAREASIDLLKLDIEGAEDAVLADCEPALDRVRALILDLHELDPTIRQTPRVLDRLARAGFTYAADEFTAQPWRDPRAGGDTPFPGKALIWTMTVRAWRESSTSR